MSETWGDGAGVGETIEVTQGENYVLEFVGTGGSITVTTEGCETSPDGARCTDGSGGSWSPCDPDTAAYDDVGVPSPPTCEDGFNPVNECYMSCIRAGVRVSGEGDALADPVTYYDCTFDMGVLVGENPSGGANKHDTWKFKPRIGYQCGSTVHHVDFWMRVVWRGAKSQGYLSDDATWTSQGRLEPGPPLGPGDPWGDCRGAQSGDVCDYLRIEAVCTSPYVRTSYGRTTAVITLDNDDKEYVWINTDAVSRRCDNKP